MNPIKKLVSEAGLYGLPSILGRVFHYLLVPLHTAIFASDQYGDITELYAYVAFLNITYTFGLETAFFRFTNKYKSKEIYHLCFTLILLITTIFSAAIWLNAGFLYEYFGIDPSTRIVEILVLIMFVDAVIAVPLTQLRIESKAKKFALVRISGIVLTVVLNYLFLSTLPWMSANNWLEWPSIYSLDISYIFLANLIANSCMLLLLYSELIGSRLRWNASRIKELLLYSSPIFLMGLSGMMVENFDKLVFEALLPDDFYPDHNAEEALGIYSAAFKLSVFMSLAVQAFRYAGEPFFFGRSEDKEAPELFAKVLYYFVWLSLIIWLGVSINASLIGDVFLRGKDFKEALYIVPILLFAKMLYGIYINVSIWFKITDKTIYGIYISVAGAVVVMLALFFLVPLFGYIGAAISITLAYASMLIYGYLTGQKYYFIPYPVKKIMINIAVTALIILSYYFLKPSNAWLDYTVGIMITIAFVLYVYWKERKHIFSDKF